MADSPLLRNKTVGVELDNLTELNAVLEIPLKDEDRCPAARTRQQSALAALRFDSLQFTLQAHQAVFEIPEDLVRSGDVKVE